MEALRGVFPDVPEATLHRVLEICDNSVEAASEWILEHDWRDLAVEDAREGEERREEGASRETASARTGSAAAEGDRPVGSAGAREDEDASETTRPQTVVVSAGTVAGNLLARERRRDGHGPQRFFARSSMLGSRFYDSGGEHDGDSDEGEEDEDEDEDDDDEDEDEDDDDDDDDDEDEDGNVFFDSGDDAFVQGMLPPLTKRVKISNSDEDKASDASADGFWVAFDDVIVNKNLIELLNTTLSKLAHSRVVLLNRPSGTIDPSTAATKLRSVLSRKDASSIGTRESAEPPRAGTSNGRISLSLLLNSSSPPAAISPIESKVSTLPSSGVVGQKRKRIEEEPATTRRGFFAHFFPVSDLDMVWRSVMHAHLFNSRFGETIEFHTASSGLFNRRDFDELMHLHSHSATTRTSSLSMSPFTSLKCCLILPCAASDEEIFRVGKHLHSLLKLQGSLYYRTLDEPGSNEASSTSAERRNSLSDLLGEDGKMTEDSFRRFAKYRIKREESATNDGARDAGKQLADHFLGYQRPRSVDYCLQILKTDGWGRQLSS